MEANAQEGLAQLALTIGSSVVLGIAGLLLMYKMIEGELPFGVGISAIICCFGLLALAVHPPHPALSGVILVVVISLFAFFPYAQNLIEEIQLRGMYLDQLDKAYCALKARPENAVAKLGLAKALYEHGFPSHAASLAERTLSELSGKVDEVKNTSFRDMFRAEDGALRKWKTELQGKTVRAVACTKCGTVNAIDEVFCTKCQHMYLLDQAGNADVGKKVYAKLVLSWALVAALIVAASALSLMLEGIIRFVVVLLCAGVVGGILYWLFKPPTPGTAKIEKQGR